MKFTLVKATLFPFICLILTFSAGDAVALDYCYRGGGSGYVSPDMPCRFYFQPTKKRNSKYTKCHLIMDLPEGITPVGASARRTTGAVVDPSKFATGQKIKREKIPYRRYDIPIPRSWNAEMFIYLATSLKPGTKTTLYYWGVENGKKWKERSLPVEVIKVHKVRNKPKRLMIGEGWDYREAFLAWPEFEKHYTSLGMKLISLTEFSQFQPRPTVSEDWRTFVKRCTDAGIYVGVSVSPGSGMRKFGKEHPEILARNSEGNIFGSRGKSALCPSYRGEFFDKSMLTPLRNIAAHGISMVNFDYELGYGNLGNDNQGNNYVCFCERCRKKFKDFCATKYPKLEWKDPREFELMFERYKDHHEAWKEFLSDQIAEWFSLGKQAFREACQKYRADSSPGVLFSDYSTKIAWENVHTRLFYAPKNLKNGLDFQSPTFYRPQDPAYSRNKADRMRTKIAASQLLPWVTPGYYGGKGNVGAKKFRYMLMEILANGVHGMLFFDGCGFDGRDFDVLSRVIDTFVPVEDIIIDGEHITVKCSDADAVAHGQKKGDEMVLLISEYGKEKKDILVTVPLEKKSVVYNLTTGNKLTSIGPGRNSFRVILNQERQVLVHIKPEGNRTR